MSPSLHQAGATMLGPHPMAEMEGLRSTHWLTCRELDCDPPSMELWETPTHSSTPSHQRPDRPPRSPGTVYASLLTPNRAYALPLPTLPLTPCPP